MNTLFALLAAAGSTAFFADLLRDARTRRRPHIVAYTIGVGMFALATWALVAGIVAGWGPVTYKVFFLFGAVLNIPFLALGSVFLVIGRRAGRAMTALLLPFAAITTLVILPARLVTIPAGVAVPSASETFVVRGPAIFAAIGGGAGATLLIVLALVSAVRFWRVNRAVFLGNVLIVAGTFAASGSGTVLAVTGRSGLFAGSLFVAAALIWAGYRVASGKRTQVEAPGPVGVRPGDGP